METAKLFQEAQDSDIPIMYLSIPENGSCTDGQAVLYRNGLRRVGR